MTNYLKLNNAMKQLLLSLLTILLPMVASATSVEIDGIYYNIISKGKGAEVTSNPNKYTGSVVIPESVTYEGTNYSVTSIGNKAFHYCFDLTSVTIPNSVISIDDFAFQRCESLTSVIMGNSVTSIGHATFNGCFSLTSITIPNSMTEIGEDAFFNCDNMTSVYISDIEAWCKIKFSVGSNPLIFAHHLFLNDTEITKLVIPNSLTSISSYAFSGCYGLTSVTIPNSVASIGDYTFSSCKGLTSISIPNSVTSIGEGAFAGSSGLISISLPNNVTSIGYSTFSRCKALTSVTIPNGVTIIGGDAFEECSALTSVSIPSSVTSIGYKAFYGCTSLTSVYINDIAAWCKISFSMDNTPRYYSNPLYYAHHLYLNDTEIKDLVIPNSVTYIGEYTFINCTGLTSVTIPNSVTSIGSNAFSGCSGLTSVSISNSVKSIGYRSFYSCTSLTSITIGTGIKNINDHAFASCSDLFDVFCYSESVPTTSSDAFEDSYIDYATLHVPSASIDAYKRKSPWKNFKSIVAIDSDTEGIANIPTRAVMIKSEGGLVIVQGAEDGERVSLYNVSGSEEGTAISHIGTAIIRTTMPSGSPAIVKIGEKSIKVVIK